MALIVKGLKLIRRIFEAPAWYAVRGPEVSPGAAVISDEDLMDHVRRTCTTAYHPVGTCSMGCGPECAVVDPELRVHGVDGLRVVDASIMPRLVGGNTHAPTVMIAEKASDMILGRPALPAAEHV